MSKHRTPWMGKNAPVNPNGGPNTQEGKEISSRNALKHGSCSMSTLILPNEDIKDFYALEKNWFAAYKPAPGHESELVRDAVRADWFFQRSDRNYSEVEAAIYAQNPEPFTWDDEIHKKQKLFLRYRTTQANLLAKARKAIEDYRKARIQETTLEAKKETAVARNRPEPTWRDDMEDLKRQAIELGYLTPDGKPTGKR